MFLCFKFQFKINKYVGIIISYRIVNKGDDMKMERILSTSSMWTSYPRLQDGCAFTQIEFKFWPWKRNENIHKPKIIEMKEP